jgi:amidohydrolase
MNTLKEKIKALAKENSPLIISIRRHLHQNPELSFEEYNTSAYVSEFLKQQNIPHKTGVAKTGIVALIEGKNPDKKMIALRADMDALPILETNKVDYCSKNNGVMHACGHDVHTASLLGTAKILNELKGEFEGTIKLIFQPGEERIPGGASMMIKEGVLENPAPHGIIGQHVMPFIDAGKVGFREGIYMASADEIYVTVKGKGGHAAMPHQLIDPVLISSHLIIALQQIVSRNANPSMPSVLSFGKIIGNGATNVIPDEVKLEGTFRTFDETWRMEAHKRMKTLAEELAKSMGGTCEFNILKGYPVLINEENITRSARHQAEEFLGKENVESLPLWTAAEDFASYAQIIPGCFYRLGVRNEARGIISPVHTSTFDIDETALETGMGLMAWLAITT